MRISGVSVGKVKSIDLGDDGLAEAELEIQAEYAPTSDGHAGDPETEDAPRRDIRRADPRQRGRVRVRRSPRASRRIGHDPRGRRAAARRRSPTRSSSTRSSGPSTTRPATRSRPGCRARPRPCAAAATTCRWRSRASTRSPRRPTTRCALLDSQKLGGPAPGARRRRGLRGALRAPRPAARADRELERGLHDDREPRRRAGRDLPDLPDVPARVARDAHAPRRVRHRHRPAGPAAAAGGPGAEPDPDRPRRALAGARGVLRGPARDDRRVQARAAGAPAACSTTTCGRCSPALDPYLAQFNSIFEGLRLYRRRSRRRSPTSRPRSLSGVPEGSATQFFRFIRTLGAAQPAGASRLTRGGSRSSGPTPTSRPAASTTCWRGLDSYETRHCATGIRRPAQPRRRRSLPRQPLQPDPDLRLQRRADSDDIYEPGRPGTLPCTQQPDFDSIGEPAEQTPVPAHRRAGGAVNFLYVVFRNFPGVIPKKAEGFDPMCGRTPVLDDGCSSTSGGLPSEITHTARARMARAQHIRRRCDSHSA